VSTELKQHEIWIEQCEAAQTINERYGLKAAFDYIVGGYSGPAEVAVAAVSALPPSSYFASSP
jgi:hypothetical protein